MTMATDAETFCGKPSDADSASDAVQQMPGESADAAVLLDWVAGFYQRTLAGDPAARQFLHGAGLDLAEPAPHRLGYANRTLGAALAATSAGRKLRARLQSLGVFRADSGHEHLNGCLVFPLSDAAGQVVQLCGYRLAPTATPRCVSLPDNDRGLWNAAGLPAGDAWILCTDPLDALTLWHHGFTHTGALLGAALNSDCRALIANRKPGRVTLIHASDTAGTARAEALESELSALGVTVSRKALPAGQTANDLARAAEDPVAALHTLLATKRPTTGRTPSAAANGKPANGSALAPLDLAVLKRSGEEILLAIADPATPPDSGRTYRVRGLARNTGYETLKVSLRVACGNGWHLDTVDLAQARQRASFVAAAAEETGLRPELLKRDVGRVLLKLEEIHEEELLAQVAPKDDAAPMTEAEREAALDLLKAPDLWDRIAEHAAVCGIAGEKTNVLTGYLAAVSRLLDRPLAIVVQSSSAAGKTTLMDAILAFIPPEARHKYSALTGQSLFYLGRANLRNKILAIAEQEGAERASYALKLLQSEGELRLAATGKDEQTGRTETQSYVVTGPVMIFLTTTAPVLDEELQNRCIVLTVDESREQTERIHALQREARTEAGLSRKVRREELLALHRNAQRLLQPLPVFNPYADRLRFLSDQLRTRRDHEKYLLLIDALAVLFQHQRARRTISGRECIVASLDDIARANSLAHEVLGRGLEDVPPQARRLLGLIQQGLTPAPAEAPASGGAAALLPRLWRRRDLRAFTGWSDTALKVHLGRLVELEYVLPRRDPKHAQSLCYELLYDGDAFSGRPHLSGLLDVSELRTASPENPKGPNG